MTDKRRRAIANSLHYPEFAGKVNRRGVGVVRILPLVVLAVAVTAQAAGFGALQPEDEQADQGAGAND